MFMSNPADGVMVPEYSDKKHDHSVARDRQLQGKLLAADDKLDQERRTLTVQGSYGLRPSNQKDSKFSEVTGWCPDEKILLRKPENGLTKPKTSGGAKDVCGKEARVGRGPQDLSYVFRHYPAAENYRYIEQYRREHTCSDSTNSASTRNEFLELQRFYSYRAHTSYSHPTTVGVPPPPPSHNQVRKEQAGIAQKAEKTSDGLQNRTHKYKLSPCINIRSDPEIIREKTVEDQRGSPLGANISTSRIAIQAIAKAPIAKVPTKVTVPANHSMISPSLNKTLKATRKASSPKTAPVWDNNIGAVRTLDTLACVASAADKPEGEGDESEAVNLGKEDGAVNRREDEAVSRTAEHAVSSRKGERAQERLVTPHDQSDSDQSDAVSMERLSTTCLGAEVSVKPRPRLEPSCTYHVFPSEDMLTDAPTLFTSSMLWNPSKSTFERRPQVVHFDPGLNAPFKAVAGLRMKMSDKDQMVKEFINNMKPLNLSLNTEVPRAEIQRGLRGTATKPDLPATFELQGVSRDGRPVTQGEPRQRKGRLRHRDGDRKAHSASTTDTANSMRLKPTAADGERSDASTTATAAQQPSVPYFKFWNSSLPPRLKGDNQVKREQNGGRELNLREMAELMLANEQLPDGELQDLVRRRANQSPPSGPSIASGVYDAFNVTAPAAAYNLLLEQRGRDVEGQDVRYYLAYAPTLPAAAGPTGECQYFTTFSHGDVASDSDREYSCTCFVKDDCRACASLSQGLPPNLPLDWPPDLPLPLLPPSVTAGSHCQPDQQQCSRSATPGGTTLHGHHIHLGSRTSVQRPASYVNYMYFQNCFSKPLQPRMPVAHQHGSATSRDCSPIREECCWDCGAPTVSPVALAVAGTDSLSIRERSSLECDVPTISPFSVDNICKYSLPTSNRAVLECGVDAVSVGDTHQEWSCSECGATRVSPAGGGDACQDVLSEALLDGTGGENSLKEQQVFLTDTSQEGDLSQRSSPLPGGTSSSSMDSSVSHTDQPVNKQADSNTENQRSRPHQSPQPPPLQSPPPPLQSPPPSLQSPPPPLQSPPPPDTFHSGDTEPDVYHCVGGERDGYHCVGGERDGYHCVGSQSDTGEQSEGACENSKSATQEVSADKEPHTSDSCKSSPGKRTIDIVTWSCVSHVDTSEDSDSLSLASSAYKYRATGQKGHHTGRGGFRSQRKPLDKNRPCPSKRSPPHPTLISFKERIQLTAEEKECWHPKNRYGFRPQLQRSRCPSQANCSPVSVYSIGGRQPLTSSSTSKQNHPLYKSINTELRNRIASYSAMFRQRPVSNPSSSYSAMFRQRPVSNPSSSYSAMFRQRPVSNPSSSYSATFKEMPVSHSSFDLNRRNPDVGHPNYDARYLNRDAAYLNRDAAHLNCDPSYLNQDPNYLNRDTSYLNPDGSYLNFGVGVGGGSRRERQEQVLRSAPHLSPQIMRKKNAQQREADLTAHYCNSRTRRMVTGSRLSGTDQKWMSMGCPSEMVVDGKSCWLQYMGRKHLSNDYYAMCTRRPHDNQ